MAKERLKEIETEIELFLASGLTEKQIEQLLHFSLNDSSVSEQTSDPIRFKDKDAYEKWLKKGRTVHTLTNAQEDLLGIIWYGQEDFPNEADFIEEFDPNEYGVTFAIRIYEKARGKKLSQHFMRASLESFVNSDDHKKIERQGIWLETSITNNAAVTSYTKFGYKQVSKPNHHGRILMILPTPQS